MGLSADLIEVARGLARGAAAGQQARLRRAVSTAYYALFHGLLDEACRAMARGQEVTGLRSLLKRTFSHAEMKAASVVFEGPLPAAIVQAVGAEKPPTELTEAARLFGEMQVARHEADYDRTRHFAAAEVRKLIDEVARVMATFRRWRDSRVGRVYLALLFVGSRWKR